MKFIGDISKYNNVKLSSLLSLYPDTITLLDFGQPLPPFFNTKQCILICQNEDCSKIIPYIYEKKISHVIQAQRNDFANELALSVQMILSPGDFISNPLVQIYGEKKCRPQFKIKFNAMDEKPNILAKFSQSLEAISGVEIMKDTINNMVDELFTNALYNAPVDKEGNHLFQDTDRTDKVILLDVEYPQLFLYSANGQAVIGCKDPFGSMDLEKLLKRLANLYSSEKGEVRMEAGGAGVGYRMMLENSRGLYVAVHEKKMTVVCFTVLLGESLKKTTAYPKNLHFISFSR